MSTIRRCDACGREAQEKRPFQDFTFLVISVEANEDADCFDACSWACVAQVAIARSAHEVSGEARDGRAA